ncbi:uncharacterized protein A1O5_07119 [Cladophialophora psammophila CBS 110553]|uniref:Mid2 domain-containing protein n=1 Tax=Cladophialophora psammophila CBS 110553 TaxID=1182543 RepID=W9WZE6_9EURO|nr:uncharacterized protein A1O5_07119 [Cladophialophora psammophila CBS 110553]EXJ70046.1 hypothetical protein A1O5_07119 [Cladophialophora psammophila CBS 110553]
MLNATTSLPARVAEPIIEATQTLSDRKMGAMNSWITLSPPDFTSNLTIGDFYLLSWESDLTNDFALYAPSADANSVDLWITDYNLHIYSHLIAARQNLNVITSLSWRVEVPSDELLDTNQWVFRWLPQGVNYSETSEQVSSPGFLLQNLTEAATATTSSSNSTATPTVITSSGSSTSVTETHTSSGTSGVTTSRVGAGGANSATTTPDSSTVSHGLSTGAKAGIAIGAIIGAAFLLGVGWVLARKIRNKNGDGTGQALPTGSIDHQEMKSGAYMQRQYVPTTKSQPPVSELDSSLPRPVPAHELPAH